LAVFSAPPRGELEVAKVDVEGSNPFSRSTFSSPSIRYLRMRAHWDACDDGGKHAYDAWFYAVDGGE
jgi:hypothetical protein